MHGVCNHLPVRSRSKIACFHISNTNLSHSDGQKGIIRYRNIPIKELFHRNDFEDVMYLLIWGSLPSLQEKQNMEMRLAEYANPPATVRAVVSAFP